MESCGIQSWRRSLWIFEHLRPSKTRQRSCICIRPSCPDLDLANKISMAQTSKVVFSECQQGTLTALLVTAEIERCDRCRLGASLASQTSVLRPGEHSCRSVQEYGPIALYHGNALVSIRMPRVMMGVSDLAHCGAC